MFEPNERRYLEASSVARLSTADAEGRPHVVPICFALVDIGDGAELVTPIDEKPKNADPMALRRSRNIEANPQVALVADHYTEDWSQLGWVQVRGTANHLSPGDGTHRRGVAALRRKYDQYAAHALEERPLIRISPERVLSWGRLKRPVDAPE